MSRIVCGHFDQSLKADAALQALFGAGFVRSEIDSSYVSPPGRMIAVLVEPPDTDGRAIEVLRRSGARPLWRAEGTWRNGSWLDFDPRSPLAAV